MWWHTLGDLGAGLMNARSLCGGWIREKGRASDEGVVYRP